MTQKSGIDKLIEDAKVVNDGTSARFELNGYKFRFLPAKNGLIRKRRTASNIFQIGSSPDDHELDAISAFMNGFSITKGEYKKHINDDFTLDDFFADVPEVVDGVAVQLELMQTLHTTAAIAILGNAQAKALTKSGDSTSQESAASSEESTSPQATQK